MANLFLIQASSDIFAVEIRQNYLYRLIFLWARYVRGLLVNVRLNSHYFILLTSPSCFLGASTTRLIKVYNLCCSTEIAY